MAELIALPPQVAELEAGGYIAQPEGTIEITENGIHDVKAFANADVNVQPDLIDKTVTENGIYKASEETPPVDGYRQVEVDVPDPVLEHGSATPKTTAETYTPQGDGFSDFTVEATPLEEKTITPTTREQTVYPQSPNIGFSSVTVEGYVPPAPVEEKDVNFYDYDGTLLYAYSKFEFLELESLPELPSHEGLICQGWNRTFLDMQDYVLSCGIDDAGAIYITDDESTRLYLNIKDPTTLTPNLHVRVKQGTLTIYINDIQFSSLSTSSTSYQSYIVPLVLPTPNEYPANYIISLSYAGSGSFLIGHGSFEKRVFGNDVNNHLSIYKVECGYNMPYLGYYSFFGCINIESITLPNGNIEEIAENSLAATGIKCLILPLRNMLLGNNCLINCYKLQKIIFPNIQTQTRMNVVSNTSINSANIRLVTIISQHCFENCFLLETVIIPNKTDKIEGGAFSNCTALKIIDMSGYSDPTAIPILTITDALLNTPSNQIIYVKNQEMLDAFSGATNWSTYASRFQIKPSGV